jgi:hypothetical protein
MYEIQRMTTRQRHEQQTHTYRVLIDIAEEVVGNARVGIERTRTMSWPASVDVGRLLAHERSAAQAPPEAPTDRLGFSQLTNATSMPCLGPGPDGPFLR